MTRKSEFTSYIIFSPFSSYDLDYLENMKIMILFSRVLYLFIQFFYLRQLTLQNSRSVNLIVFFCWINTSSFISWFFCNWFIFKNSIRIFDLISVESCSEKKKNHQSEKSFKTLVRKANFLHHCKNIAFKEIFLGNHYCTTDKYLLKDHLLSSISKGKKLSSPALFLRHFW